MSEAEATGRMRWARRTIRPNAAIDHTHTVEILQQEFVTRVVGTPMYEWRDVPTEME